MRILKSLLIVIFELAIIQVKAQEYKNNVILELGGNAYYYSLNYERSFAKKIVFRTGISYLEKSIVLPNTIGMLVGKNKHYLEIAVGGVYMNYHQTVNGNPVSRKNSIAMTGVFGYRYVTVDRRVLLKAGYTPFLPIYNDDPLDSGTYPTSIRHWVGAGVGYMF